MAMLFYIFKTKTCILAIPYDKINLNKLKINFAKHFLYLQLLYIFYSNILLLSIKNAKICNQDVALSSIYM